MSFKGLALNKPILRAVAEQGYDAPTLVQQKTIPEVLAGHDAVVSAQTGTGKTAAFVLPILQLLFDKQDASKRGKKIRALIISPTRELAIQIQERIKAYSTYTNLRSTVIYGGVGIEPQIDVLNKGVDIVVGTPGRLLDLHKQDILHLDFVETLVIDEADLLLDMGFIDDVNKLTRLCPEDRQTLLFSATIPYKVAQLAQSILKEPKSIEVNPSSSVTKNISQRLYYVPKRNKIELCLHLLRNTIKGTILIFRRTKFGVDKLEQTLLKNGYSVATIHGDKTQTDRQESLKKFKNGYVSILIATDVAARGIDIQGLDAVINFDLPNVPEVYVHRIGRTGRAEQEGVSYAFCGADEKTYIDKIQQLMNVQIMVETEHPYPLDPNEKPIVHKKQGSKHKKGRKGDGSKKKKRRWY